MELNHTFLEIKHLETNYDLWTLTSNEENDCTTIIDDNDSDSIISVSSNDSEKGFCGFETASLGKTNDLLSTIIKALESDILNCEIDVIDGVEFISFKSELELMEFSKHQQDQRESTSQSDDGLEILDDGSFSDISSTHAIVPTKTKDITRIKGWRNKNFVGILDLGDSGSSVKNDDDGFGDDVEMKSVHDESSEEVDSVDFAIPTVSMCSYETESLNPVPSSNVFLQTAFENTSISSSSPGVEDNNAETTGDCRFNFQQSFNTKPLNFLNNAKHEDKDVSTRTTSEVKSMNLSFNPKCDPSREVNPLVSPATILTAKDSIISQKTYESALYKETDQKKFDHFSVSNKIYKPRVKHSLIESIARKINADNGIDVIQASFTTSSKSKTSNEVIRWHVPKEKLLCGNIYDLEVSLASSGLKEGSKAGNCDTKVNSSISDHSQEGSKNHKREACNFSKILSDNGAFQSSTLDEYTTSLDKLHIDFTIPKLDAANNVTHEVIELPIKENKIIYPAKTNKKPMSLIKAKTVAEKKRLIEQMNNRDKRKKKLSFKLKYNEDQHKSKTGRQQINKKKHQQQKTTGITKECSKKIKPVNNWIDNQGIITYGREKPLNSRLTGNLIKPKNKELCYANDKLFKLNSNIAMVINVGFKRPLYKEVADNIKNILDDNGNISLTAAEFAVSAIQCTSKPFTVTRFLVPVTDKSLKDLMYRCKERQDKVQQNKFNKSIRKRKMNLSEDLMLKLVPDSNEKMSRLTEQFAEENDVDSEVCKTLDDIVSFVDRKEFIDSLEYSYDPQIPVKVEKELDVLAKVNTRPIHEKTKKTKLQRQIEHLGGTFIAIDSEDESNVNFSETQTNEKCLKDCCELGCVCLINMSKIEHCGKDICMFSCNCSVSLKKKNCDLKSKIWLLPEVLRQKKTLQKKLAPVEREYHQTVIMSENKKTITMDSLKKKRERKIPSKFKDEILLDYRTADCDFNLLKIVDRPMHHHQELMFNTKRKPKIQSVKSFLKLQQKYYQHYLIKENLKPCFVQIERDIDLNQVTTSKPALPELHEKRNKTNINVRAKSRNVAVKKTGSPTHCFATENHCSRTFGVSNYITWRNKFCKMKTKNLLMYVAQESAYHSVYSGYFKEDYCVNIKEDLETESEIDIHADDLVCLENMPQDEGSGLAIDFICSLPPDIFEKQDTIDNEDNCKLSLPENIKTVNESQKVCSNGDITNKLPKGKNETIVYATLPSTNVGCKWWVVEMDVNKFSNLIYVSDKRCLSFKDMSRATFKAAFGEKTVRIPLGKFHGNHQDKFGAYAVPGHNHLIFFGPYDINESHGFTAIKSIKCGHQVVPFTSTFSDSEVFKSLGIDLSQNNKNLQVSTDSVKAVWWYSTAKTSSSYTNDNCSADRDMNNLSVQSKNVEEYASSLSNEVENIDLPKEYIAPVEVIDTSQDIANENLDHIEIIKESSSIVSVDHSNLLKNNEQNNDTLQKLKSDEGISEKRRRRRRRKEGLTIRRNKIKFNSSNKPENSVGNFKATNASPKQSRRKSQPTERNYADPVCLEDIDLSESSEDGLFCDKNVDYEIVDNFENSQRIVHKPLKKSATYQIKEGGKPEPIPKALVRDKPFTEACPQLALLCLSPGVGYIPVLEHDHQKLVLKDPIKPHLEHQFSDASQASEWLNEYMKLITDCELLDETSKWVMVKGSFIKFLEPLNKEFLKNNTSSQVSDPRVREKNKERKELERVRRMQLRHLLQVVTSLIFPNDCDKLSLKYIIRTAQKVIEAQALIATELIKEKQEWKNKTSMLDLKLKNMIANLNDKERKKAMEISIFYKHKKAMDDIKFKSKDRIDENILIMKDRELRIVHGKKGRSDRIFNSESTSKMDSNSHCQQWRDAAEENPQPQLESSSSSNSAILEPEPTSSVLVTEGVLMKRNKPNTESTQASVPDRNKPETNSNVICLIDSDEEDKQERVIEIDSEEEEVVWIPDKNPFDEDDVQIISTRINRKNRKVEFPKPKKRLPQFKRLLNRGIGRGVSGQETVRSPISLHSSESVVEEPKRQVPGPEIVSTDEDCESVFSSVESVELDGPFTGCSRSDPLMHSIQGNKKKDLCDSDSPINFNVNNLNKDFFARSPQFLPINQSPRINIVNTSARPLLSVVNRPSQSQPVKTITRPPLNHQLSSRPMTLSPHTLVTSAVSAVPVSLVESSVQQTSRPTDPMNDTTDLGPNLTSSSSSISYPITYSVPQFKNLNASNYNILLRNKFSCLGKINTYSSDTKGKRVMVKIPQSILNRSSNVSLLKNSRPAPYILPAASPSTSGSGSSVGVQRENTVTLHHPSGEISETRTVQFADTHTDSITGTVEKPSYLDGPKIRSPKAGSNLRVILPKRSS